MKFESQLQIVTAAGVPPFTVNQTALVINLNADLLDGQHGSYYAAASSLGNYLPLTGGTLTGTLTGTIGIFTTVRATELTSLLGSNGPITITPDGTGHVHINSTDIRLGPNNTNATLATRGTGDLILRTNEGSATEGFIRIYDGANGNIEITPNGTGTVVVGKLSGSTASFSGQVTSTVATGTAPLVIASTTAVANLNADLLDGQHGSYYQDAGNLNAGTLLAARLPAFTGGDVTSSAGSAVLTLATVATAGTYRSVTVDAKGRVTAGTNPTTLAGYAISDAMKIGGAPGVDLNTLTTSGVYRINNTEANRPNDWGQLLVMYGGSDTITQIYGHYVDGTLKTRSGNPTNVGGSGSWSPWRTLLADHNYSSYALPLTGGTITGQLSVNGSTASDILRLYTTGSTVWKLGVTDASGSYFNITADFGNFTINKSNGNVTTPGAFVSTVATGTAPLTVTSTTLVSNLNSQYLNGQLGSYYENRDTTAVGFSGGTLTLTRASGNLTTSLDGRYLLLSGGAITGNTTFSGDNHLTFGPNSTWSNSIRIGGNGYTATGTQMASVATTNGNLHLDSAKLAARGVYLNWYGGDAGTYFGNGSGGQSGRVDGSGNASFGGTVTSNYGTFSAPGHIIGDAQYGFYASAGSLFYKSASTGNHIWRNIANSANTMTLDNSGNLTINGTLTEGGYLAFPERVYTINLSAQSAANFYPIVINGSPGNDPWHHRFSLEMPSLGGGSAYNMDHVHGEARGQGWSDQTGFYRIFHNCYEDNERSVLGLWRGTQDWYGIVLYVRGGQTYYVRTTSRSVAGFTAATTQGNATFAIKNAAGADVSGTSAAIGEMFNLINTPQGFHSSSNNYINGTQVVTNTGTWGISITGSAAQLNGQAASYYENRDTTAVGFSGGTLTLTRAAGNLTASLDGRYLPLTGGTLTGALNGTSASFSGNVRGGRVTLRDDCLEQHVDDSDSVGIFVNYFGFASGVTRFRNFGVFNGKNQQLFYITGSTGATAITGTLSVTGAITQGGNQVLHAGNYTSYAIARGGDTVDGVIYFRSNKGSTSTVGANNTYQLEAYSTDGGAAGMSFHRAGYYAVNMGLDPDNVLRIGGWSASANRWQLDMSGNNTIAGNLTAVNGLFSGNIGAGTSSPYGRLDLGADTGRKLFIYGQGGNVGYITGLGVDLSGSSALSFFTGIGRFEWVKGTGNYPYSAYTVQMTLDASSNLNVAGAITQGGNQVVHAGNVSTYALPIGGGTLTGNLVSGAGYQVRWSDGSAAAPGYSFYAETGTGMYRAGTNTLGFATGGVQRLSIDGSGNATLTGAMTASSFSGSGASLTGTAASLNIGGNAATATRLTNLTSTTTSTAGTDNSESCVSYINGISLFGQTDGALYSHVYSASWKHNIYGDYRTGQLAVRGKNNGTWQAWRVVLDSSNFNSYALPLSGGTLTGALNVTGIDQGLAIQHNGNAAAWYGRVITKNSTSDKASFLGTYGSIAGVFAHNNALTAWADLYINTVDGSSGGTVRMPSSVLINGNQALHAGSTSAPSLSIGGNAATATNLSTNRTNWSTNGVISAVVGQLAWKHYNNNHTIFDASNSTSPAGGAISNTNAEVAWSSTYPTLMGWNGANTYGVRVDSARIADSASQLGGQGISYFENRDITAVGFASGTLTLTRAAGNLSVSLDGRYLTGNQTISLTGAVTGSGTTSIATTLANSTVTYAKIQNVGVASVLGNSSASVSQAPQEITFGNLNNLLSGAAKAWVTFNENPTTGAITINASFNVSSITRINYGQYRVNFSTAFGDANYAISGTIGFESNGGYLYGGFLNVARSATPKTTTYCEVTASYGDGNTYNARYVHVVIDR